MRHDRFMVLGAAAAALAVTLASCGGDQGDAQATDSDVVAAEGRDLYPTQTASDWVAHADHVVVVTAVDESEPPSALELEELGEGYVPRTATLQVDRVLWSDDAAQQAAPEGRIEWDAWGWELSDGELTPMAAHDQPRVEVGHSYILAIVWEPAVADGGEQQPAGWNGLGGGAIVPYDGGVVGLGESEGTTQTDVAPLDASDPNLSLEDQLAGQDADALVAALDNS